MNKKRSSVFLNLVGAKLKENRPLISDDLNYSFRVERIANVPFVSLWFRTRGCKHDYMGGCTMCNYGKSNLVTDDEMIKYVKQGLAAITVEKNAILLLETSGSMFDDWEIPATARRRIFELVKETKFTNFLCETRADTITSEKVNEYKKILNKKRVSIELGLETSNPWIMQYCINKNLNLDEFLRSIDTIRQYHVPVIANVIVGTPFLSEREAIDDSVSTIQWALRNGVDQCVLFPVHVKQWTLVEWLWKHDLYTPVSLWSLVEVLKILGPSLASKVTISWYKTYNEQSTRGTLRPEVDWGYLKSPTTCPKCQARVIDYLDSYRDTNDFDAIEELVDIQCECKVLWHTSINAHPTLSLPARVANAYEEIGEDLLGNKWWEDNKLNIYRELFGQY